MWFGVFFLLVRCLQMKLHITGLSYFFKKKHKCISFTAPSTKGVIFWVFSSRNWARYLLPGPNHLNGTWVQLRCSKTNTYPPLWVAYGTYAHAISWSGNANSNQFLFSLTGIIYDVHSLILKKYGHNEAQLGASLSYCLWIMILTAKITAPGIHARILSISAKENAVVWLPCPLNPLDISISEQRFGREMKQGKNRDARMAKHVLSL